MRVRRAESVANAERGFETFGARAFYNAVLVPRRAIEALLPHLRAYAEHLDRAAPRPEGD
jgi:hypothetical protein